MVLSQQHKMTAMVSNLYLYFSRIGLDPSLFLKADLPTLASIQMSHLRSIPFENFDVVQGKKISMALPDVIDKIVAKNRGGYCFEQNTLIAAALEQVGFNVKPVLARVRWNRPPDVKTPFTHMVLIVSINEWNYLVDVGFGGLQCLEPLQIDTDDEQVTPDGIFRVLNDETGNLTLQWSLKGAWADMYTFRNEEALSCDMQVANWWSCTWPEARWVSCLFAARIVGSERHHILNSEYVVRQNDGSKVRVQLESPEEVLALLTSVFGITLPEDIDMAKINAHVQKGPLATFHVSSY